MRNLLAVIGVSIVLTTISCTDVIIIPDRAEQFFRDSVIIADYFSGMGYEGEQVRTTPSGVSYVILDLGQEGMGNIDESDIVTFDYTGFLTNDTIFDTSIKRVADSIRTVVKSHITPSDTSLVESFILRSFSESRVYKPFTITYTSTGWTIPRGGGGFIEGFADGIAASFNKMKVGGEALIAMPSSLAYGAVGIGLLIPPNTVLLFKLYPIRIKRQ